MNPNYRLCNISQDGREMFDDQETMVILRQELAVDFNQ
jgi:hypothetical protein